MGIAGYQPFCTDVEIRVVGMMRDGLVSGIMLIAALICGLIEYGSFSKGAGK